MTALREHASLARIILNLDFFGQTTPARKARRTTSTMRSSEETCRRRVRCNELLDLERTRVVLSVDQDDLLPIMYERHLIVELLSVEIIEAISNVIDQH